MARQARLVAATTQPHPASAKCLFAESGISRRAFFSHFKPKEILPYWQDARWRAIHDDLLKTSPDALPLDAVRDIHRAAGSLQFLEHDGQVHLGLQNEQIARLRGMRAR